MAIYNEHWDTIYDFEQIDIVWQVGDTESPVGCAYILTGSEISLS